MHRRAERAAQKDGVIASRPRPRLRVAPPTHAAMIPPAPSHTAAVTHVVVPVPHDHARPRPYQGVVRSRRRCAGRRDPRPCIARRIIARTLLLEPSDHPVAGPHGGDVGDRRRHRRGVHRRPARRRGRNAKSSSPAGKIRRQRAPSRPLSTWLTLASHRPAACPPSERVSHRRGDDITPLAILAATQNHFTMSLIMRSGLSGPSGI